MNEITQITKKLSTPKLFSLSLSFIYEEYEKAAPKC
jgi:hypothetical protein